MQILQRFVQAKILEPIDANFQPEEEARNTYQEGSIAGFLKKPYTGIGLAGQDRRGAEYGLWLRIRSLRRVIATTVMAEVYWERPE